MSLKDYISNVDLLIFDFDGTLFQGEQFSLPIFHDCLKKVYSNYQIDKAYPSDEIILSQFGKQVEDIYNDLFGNNAFEIIKDFSECVATAELQSFQKGRGELFPNVEIILANLKKSGFKLAICTNAPKDYWEGAVQRFQLEKYFDLMMAAGLYPGKNKSWMVHKIVETLKSNYFIVIGDRYHDIEAAKANGGLSVGCKYGYGRKEIQKADIVISDITELLSIFSIPKK